MKTSHTNQPRSYVKSRILRISCALLALIPLAFSVGSLHAQTAIARSQPIRLTVPKGVAHSNFTTLTITTSGLVAPATNVALTITGIPGSGNAFAWLSQTAITSNAAVIVTLSYTNDSTIAAGSYDMAVVASGDASYRLPLPVQVAYIWSGLDYTNAVSTNFASANNWIGSAVPGASDPVVFKEGHNGTSPTNVIITANTEVASMRFSPESGNRNHNVEIQSGATLKVSGSGLSFSLHRDTKLLAQTITTTFSGSGTLRVTNANAEIGVLLDGQQNTTLDLRNLNNFVADVSRIGLGNHRMWPNYYTNGYVGSAGAAIANPPTRFVPLVFLAKTNIIKCSWVDANNYNDGGVRDYALEIGNDEASGTTANITFRLGVSNALFLDSICYAHSGKGGGGNSFIFNSSGSYALFRGIGGGRMSVFAMGDGSGVGPSGSNVRGTVVDFSAGQVDAMVDRLLLGRSRTNTTGMTIQGTMTLGGASLGSVFDVNTAVLGQQDFDNIGTGAGAVSGPVGTININSNATLRVNGVLHLGYTVAGANGLPTYPENCSGILNISSNGTVMASNILAGGVSKRSVQNNIFMNRGRLIVTNGVGDPTKPLNIFTITNGSALTLQNVGANNTNIFVTTLNAAVVGTAVTVNVPALTNVLWPVTCPVFSYVTAAPTIAGLTAGTLPSGVVLQSIVDNPVNKTIDFTFTTNVPKVLVWTGNANNNWDTTSTNWVTQIGATPSRFTDGDSVVFNDTAPGSTTITVVGTVVPGQTAAANGIVVNNTTKNYTFDGGNVQGGSTGLKSGTGSLTINATFNPGFTIIQGSLAGNSGGSVGTTYIGYNAVMTAYSGTVNGGLATSNALVSVLGTVNGGLSLQAGSLTNNGTIGDATLGGTVSLLGGVYLTNAATMYVTVPWNLPTNSVLVNNGTIEQSGNVGGNGGLTVNGGKFKGTGKLYAKSGTQKPDARVTFGPGSTLEIGNSANEIATLEIATRLDLNDGSTAIFDVNTSTTNDVLLLREPSVQLGHVNFGVGNNQGGTLYINKIGGPAFTTNTVLSLFNRNGNNNEPENISPAIPKVTPAPLAGYTWDVSQTITNLLIPVTTPPLMTNIVTTATNGVQSFEFTWSDSYRGWRLERQTNDLTIGLESPSTNWTTVFTGLGGTNANNLYYPNATNDYSLYYFRRVETISATNAPAVFYRLTYP